MIFGSLLVLMTLLVGVGLFYAFGFGTSTGTAGPNGRPSAPGGMRIQLSNPQWIGPGPSFTVNLETTSRRPDPTVYTLRYRSADGSVTGSSTIVQLQFQSRTTVNVNHGGFGRQPITIWIEDSRVPGQTVSNTIPLN